MSLIESSLSRSRSRFRATSKPSSSASFSNRVGTPLRTNSQISLGVILAFLSFSRTRAFQSTVRCCLLTAAGWRDAASTISCMCRRAAAWRGRLTLKAAKSTSSRHCGRLRQATRRSLSHVAGGLRGKRRAPPQGLLSLFMFFSSASSTLRQRLQRTDTQFRRLVRVPGLPQISHVRMDSRVALSSAASFTLPRRGSDGVSCSQKYTLREPYFSLICQTWRLGSADSFMERRSTRACHPSPTQKPSMAKRHALLVGAVLASR